MSDRSQVWLVAFVVFLSLLWIFPHDKSTKIVVTPAPIEAPKSSTVDEKMVAAGIQCPNCLDVPDGLERIRKTVLSEGPIISTPTKEYLEYLTSLCNSNRFSKIGKIECNKALTELEKARDTQESWVNPIYGHPPFTEGHVNFLRRSSSWVEGYLTRFERNWVGTKKERYLRDQRRA